MSFFPEFSIETWVLIATVLTLIAIYGYAPYSFFKKIGIQGPTPLPFIGTYLEYRKGAQYLDMECYQKYGKLWGLYDGRQPLLAVMDTAMIKTILVKECYTIFTNRRDVGLSGQLYDAVFLAEDNEWKRIRSVLSPSFTSGRLKEMYSIMLKHSSNLIKGLHKQVKEKKEIIEVKQVFGPYSMDVVAGAAFSVDIDSINRPSDPFVTNMKRLLSIYSFKNPLLIVIVLFPFLAPFLEKMGLSLFPADVMKFFYNSIEKIKSDRNKNNHKNRVDFMQLMVDSQISENQNDTSDQKGLTDHEILSQAMIFFLAGYESSSSSLCFLAYNLATNPHTQKTLQEEIDKTFPEKGQPTYDALMQMEYLDMVVNESLRLYPINNRLERVAKTSTEVNGVTIPKGTTVMIPLYTLHRDPAMWSEPEDFKPERFSKENKDNIDPYAFLTFGAGPRNCLGMRFAVLMMKLAIVEILQNFSLVACKETQIPMVLANDFFTTPKTPIKLGLEPRASAADSFSG